MYEIRPIRFLPVFLMYTKRQRGLDMCATDSKKPPLFSQASLTKVQTIWAMIWKLSEVNPWWSKWGATRETSQVLTYGLYFPSSPREDSPPQLPLLSTLPLPSVGSNPVLTMPRIQSFPEVLSQHPTAELRAGHRTIQACTAKVNLGKGTWKIPPPCLTGRSACGDLDWPVSLTPPQGWSVLPVEGWSFSRSLEPFSAH